MGYPGWLNTVETLLINGGQRQTRKNPRWQCERDPAWHYWTGRQKGHKEWGQPVEAGKIQKMDSPLEPPQRNAALLTFWS